MGNAEAEDSLLGFVSLQKKRWLDLRHLMIPGFLEGAPADIRNRLREWRDVHYDSAKPLTKLRNQAFISYKTLMKQISNPMV